MDRARRLALGIALWITPVTWSPRAFAMDEATKEAIRTLSNEAAADFEAARFELAREKFQRAYEAAPVPRLAVWLARTDVKLGRLVSARDFYVQAARLEANELWIGDAQQRAQTDAQQELAELEPRIPRLAVTVQGASPDGLVLELDGAVVSTATLNTELLTDPGTHEIGARAGARVTRRTVTAQEGERQEVVLTLEPAAPSVARPAASTRPAVAADARAATPPARTFGWIGLSVGAAGLAVGTAAGIVVAVQHGKLSDDCPSSECGPDHWSRVDTYRTWRTVATVGLTVGVVGAAAGVVLLLTNPSAAEPHVALSLGPGSAALKGTF